MEKILIYDDDLTMASLLKTLLELDGYEVIQAKQERSLIPMVRAEKPDVILLDVFLVETDGLDLLAELRATKDLADTRIIMTSGMELGHEAAEAGADAFLLKPYTPDQLISVIRGD
ncbi:MAG: response regulator [Anaerolineales bacterium]|jgi:chemosensory pili system protein ChpA (sensor histidine kinase/response regulator)